MTPVDEDALMILRILREGNYDNDWASGSIHHDELREQSGLEGNRFVAAYIWLSGEVYIKDGALTNTKFISPSGMKFLENKLASRLPLTLNAERVLRFIVGDEPPGGYDHPFKGVEKSAIQTEFSLDQDMVNRVFQELKDEDLIEPVDAREDRKEMIRMWIKVRGTTEGRIAVRRNFQKPSAPVMPHFQAIFQGDVSAQNLAVGINTGVQQTISSNPDEIRQQINDVLNQLVNDVAPVLDLEQKQSLSRNIEELIQELNRPEPDKGKLHKLLGLVTFTGNVGSAITFAAAVVASPYVPVLFQYIQKLVESM